MVELAEASNTMVGQMIEKSCSHDVAPFSYLLSKKPAFAWPLCAPCLTWQNVKVGRKRWAAQKAVRS